MWCGLLLHLSTVNIEWDPDVVRVVLSHFSSVNME